MEASGVSFALKVVLRYIMNMFVFSFCFVFASTFSFMFLLSLKTLYLSDIWYVALFPSTGNPTLTSVLDLQIIFEKTNNSE